MTANSPNTALRSPEVFLVFWGSYWNTTAGAQYEGTLLNAAKEVINSPFLQGEVQYGGDGKATLAPSPLVVKSDPPAGLRTDGFQQQANDVQQCIQMAIDTPGSPIQRPIAQSLGNSPPIYVVVAPPTKAQAGGGGWNAPGTYSESLPWGTGTDSIHMVLVRTSPSNLDQFTVLLSHEFAECVSNQISITHGANLPQTVTGDGQISDNEPNGIYDYRLKTGALVQAYWSQNDNAYIVPDGNQQTLTLDPIWNGFYYTNFTDTFNLTVKGDQIGANLSDQLTLNQTADGGVQVTLNGEQFAFAANTINQINVDTGNGANVVTVAGLPANVGLAIDSSGYGSTDKVNIGTTSHSLANIAGPINVSNHSGTTALVIDDALDPTAQNINITNNAVKFSALTVNYQAGQNNGTLIGVTSLSIKDPVFLPNHLKVDSVAPLTSTAILGNTNDILSGVADMLVTFTKRSFIW